MMIQRLRWTHDLVEFIHLCVDRELLACLQYFLELGRMRAFGERIHVVLLEVE